MVLVGVREEAGWLTSSWNLTYRVGWERICKAVSAVYDSFNGAEVLVDGKMVNVAGKDAILQLPESRNLIIRGNSTIIKSPVMLTFYNQLQTVSVTIPCMTEEFKSADYQRFNISLGQYMDSIELAMYR